MLLIGAQIVIHDLKEKEKNIYKSNQNMLWEGY